MGEKSTTLATERAGLLTEHLVSKDAAKVGSDRPRPFLDTLMTSDSIYQQGYWPHILCPVHCWLPEWDLGPLVVFNKVLKGLQQNKTGFFSLLLILYLNMLKKSFYSVV